ncbi:MAG: hypothetical protein SCH70_14210, partial [Candidatus Methanoperedens sp.]|nr:hypothetical protein [Candidatus Methanoperedens sp.]
MNESKIVVMALMVLSIFSGAAIADPIIGGGDAGNAYYQASPLVSSQLSRVGYSRDNFILASSVVNC